MGTEKERAIAEGEKEMEIEAKYDAERVVAFHGQVELVKWSVMSGQDPKVKLKLEGGRDDLGCFDGAARRRSGKAGQRYQCYWADDNGDPIEVESSPIAAFSESGPPDQVWLWGSGWHHSTGAQITVAVPWENLTGFWHGVTPGTKFFLTLVELEEDESPVDQKQAKRIEDDLAKTKVVGGPVAINAGRLCNDPEFLDFVGASMEIDGPVTPIHAAEFVRDYCKVESRAMLDHDDKARMLFEDLKSEFLKSVAAF